MVFWLAKARTVYTADTMRATPAVIANITEMRQEKENRE
jgi:hypothetical protein